MNTGLFFLTTISLGAIAGISGNHYFQVKEIVRLHQQGINSGNYIKYEKAALAENISSQHIEESEPLSEVRTVEDVNELINIEPITPPVAAVAADLKRIEREEALLEILNSMRSGQKALEQQLAETNRDLAEANFRLDTHSDSFKPLRADSEAPYSMNNQDKEDFQLLPPK